jgi:hypothetical protein
MGAFHPPRPILSLGSSWRSDSGARRTDFHGDARAPRIKAGRRLIRTATTAFDTGFQTEGVDAQTIECPEPGLRGIGVAALARAPALN